MKKYAAVEEFLSDLSPERLEQVTALRAVIQAAAPELTEHIKWNSPSYVQAGEDRITFNMHYPDKTMLLLHMGATRKEDKKGTPIMQDPTGLITWNSDIRGTLSFTSLEEIQNNQAKIASLITDWLAID